MIWQKTSEDCGFPLLAKPRRGFASRGVRVLFDRDGVEAVLACGVEMVVQEYLAPRSWNKARAEITPSDVERDGLLRQDDELRSHVLLGRSGEVLGMIASRDEVVGGRPIALEALDEPLLEVVAREGAELLGRHGMISTNCASAASGGHLPERRAPFPGASLAQPENTLLCGGLSGAPVRLMERGEVSQQRT